MIAIQFARLIANFELFLCFTDEDALHPDDAVKCNEYLDYGIEQFDRDFLREYIDAFALIATEYSGEAQEFVRDIPYHSCLEEHLAGDDPIRLAELEALRDARDDAEPPISG